MSAMKYTICPQPKKIGFLIVIEGELCSGIPEKFSADSSLNGLLPAGGKIWLVKEADGETPVQALPILWKNTGKEGKKEIFHRQQREEKGWCKEDFFWVDINSDQADLLLFNGVLEYIDMSVS